MKTKMHLPETSAVITGIVFTGYTLPLVQVPGAWCAVREAKDAPAKQTNKYLKDMDNYRNEAAEKIAANNKSLAEFKARIAEQKQEARAEYEKKIAELERKNSDAKKKLDDFKAEGKDKWAEFKVKFNREMDELADAFRRMTGTESK